MIFVATHPEDVHAAAVVDLLRERDLHVAHLEVPSLSADTEVAYEDGGWLVHLPGRLAPIDLSRARIGWWRRDPIPVLSRDLATLAEIDGAPVESTEALVGVLMAQQLDWVTSPADDRTARLRPVLWRAAASAGLRLPATTVTRSVETALRFHRRHVDAGVVVKPLVRRTDDWAGCRHVSGDDDLVEAVSDADAELVVQRAVPGTDVRVVAIGAELFAAELGVAPDRGQDTILEDAFDDHAARPIVLPADLQRSLRAMLAALGLGVAAVDLRRDAAGGFWLVDIDTVPRWLYLEELTGLPITAAMVDLLARNAHALSLG